MRATRLVVACAVAALFTGSWAGPAASSEPAESSATVGNASAAWYQTAAVSTCSSPIGCPPLPPVSPYPAGTLHVGVVAGQETARTYVRPDLSSVSAGAVAHTGTMTLPLDTTGGNGSVAPDAADVKTCLVTKAFTDVSGSFEAPPDVDCNVSSPAIHEGTALTVDLGPFLDAWSNGVPPLGIALLPITSGDATWHVVVDAKRITSTLSYTTGAPGDTRTDETVDDAAFEPPLDAGALPLPGVAVEPAPPSGASSPSPAPAAGATRGAAQPAAPVAAVGAVGFQYPQVLLLPLALLAAVTWLSRLFLRDAIP